MRASWISFPVALLVAATCAVSATVGQVGCSQSSTYVTKDQFPSEYAQALCSSLTHCCAENGVSQSYQQCTQGWESTVSALLNGPQSSGNYDVTAATQCIQAVRDAAGASCQPVEGSLSAARPVCQSVFAGQLPLGSPCTAAAQCAQLDGSEVTCAVVPGDGGASTGGGQLPLSARVMSNGVIVAPADVPVCVVVTPPEAGSNPIPCTINEKAGADTCTAQGMYCDPTSLTCQPQGASGNGCDPFVITSCSPGNYCGSAAAAGTTGDGGAGAASPILHPEATDAGDDGGGADGATILDGAVDAGDDGGGSDATTSDAAPSPEASAGDAGGGGTEGGGSGGEGGTGGGVAGVCVTAGPVGSPCTSNAMCDATGACDTTTQLCAALEPPGSPCTSGAQCTIGVCDGTTHKCLTNAIATTAACNGSSQ